ncbi:N-acetylmuramoyl-L-alanine amidase family protein [Halobacillus litoralis]|uniref:N-acetylmuramoyl-L-alanine amidase family protein n=1 Tax=Halobacillus litoralis TaxID=45668 RepID=UPI001CD4F507|nr:N-acetylmuramoyl-L-alanine amidase [Halobacillus litoralis]MCA1021668.1 N-acetylmuramoyl-L-alanine amidase [Halobacillus litoralis]
MAKLLKPSGDWNSKLVALDDGHGMQTPGKRTPYIKELGRSIKENEFNRKVVGYLADILLDHGFRVLLVAPTDYDTPLSVRTNDANRYGADIYVSVHYNAMSHSFDYSSASGISVHIYNGWLSSGTKNLANCVLKYLKQGTKQRNRGIVKNNFHVLRETNMPAILTENGFMDDREEALLMLKSSFQKEVATEHAQGICEYFGFKYRGSKSEPVVKLVKGFSGKMFEVIYDKKNDGVAIRTKPDFDANVYAEYDKGVTRTIIDKYEVDGSPMYKFKGGDGKIYYITAHEKFVRTFDKPKEEEKKDETKSQSKEEDEIMVKNLFIINDYVDGAAVEKVMLRVDGHQIYRRTAEKMEVSAKENIFVVGGGTKGLKLGKGKVTDLSGASAEKTAENVFKHFNLA